MHKPHTCAGPCPNSEENTSMELLTTGLRKTNPKYTLKNVGLNFKEFTLPNLAGLVQCLQQQEML